MDSLSFIVVVAAVILIALGVVGAAPSLFPRQGGTRTSALIGSGPLPLIERDILEGFEPSGMSYESSTTVSGWNEEAATQPEPDTEVPQAVAEAPPAAGQPEPVIQGLFTELELLRTQIQSLRSELVAIASAPLISATRPSRRNDRRRRRPRGGTELPEDLTSRVQEIRKQRRQSPFPG